MSNPIEITWHHDVVATLTGKPINTAHPSEWDWHTVLNGAGDGEHSFHLADEKLADVSQADWDDWLAKVRRTFVVSRSINGGPKKAKYAGILIGEDWDRQTEISTVQHREFRHLGDLRYFMMVNSYKTDRHFEVSGLSKAGLLTAIWERGYRRPELEGELNNFNLPVRFPPTTLGAESVKYAKWTFTTIEEATAAIQDSENGPDIYVEPMWDTVTGDFYWQAKFGNPSFPELPFDVHVGAEEHPLENLKFREDGSKVVTGVFGNGKGSDEDMKLGFGSWDPSWFVPDGMPVIDATASFKNIDDEAQLDSLAFETLRARRYPIRQYENALRASAEIGTGIDGQPVYGVDVVPGWRIEIDDPGDRRNPPSRAQQYVIGVGHNSSSPEVMTVDYQQA